MQIQSFATRLTALFAVALMAAAAVPASAAETYQVDTVHSYILFKIKHLDIGYSYGRFNGATGEVTWDDVNATIAAVAMQVNAKDVDTDVEKRDEHLRSADFFNVEKFTAISFQSTKVQKLAADSFEITGDLTLLGQTRPVTVTARETGAGQDPWGKFRRGFETEFTIKRSYWGMDFMLEGLSDEVDLTVSIEAILQP
ncbi:MAG: YceI family protein [Desulfobacterales bacterium]